MLTTQTNTLQSKKIVQQEVQLQWTPAFKIQRERYQSNQIYLLHYQHSKNQLIS